MNRFKKTGILSGYFFLAALFLMASSALAANEKNQNKNKEGQEEEVSTEFLYEEEPVSRLEEAQGLLEKQNWNYALPLFQKIVESPADKSEYEQGLWGLATCYEKVENLKQAIRYYKALMRQGQTPELKEKAKQKVTYYETYILGQFHVGKWYPKLWMHEQTEALAAKYPDYAWHCRVGIPYLLLLTYKFLLLLLFLALTLAFTSAKALQSPKRFPIAWGLPSVFIIYILFLALQGFIVFVLQPSLTVGGGEQFVHMLFELILSYLILVALVLLVLTWRGIPWRNLGIDVENFNRNLILAAKYMVVLVILFGVYAFLRAHEFIRQEKIIRTHPMTGMGTFLYGVQVFLLVVVSPFAEEIFYRGFVYPVARNRSGILGGILLTSLFFALVHADPQSTFILFGLSLALCYLYEKTRNLIPAICVHAFYNFIVLFGGTFLPSM